MTTVRIRTVNPTALADTLVSLGGGLHIVQIDTYADGVVEVKTTNEGFLTFACKNQGYGEVVTDALVRHDHPEATCGPQPDGSPTCGHASDCSTHNEPALPAGHCTCGRVRYCCRLTPLDPSERPPVGEEFEQCANGGVIYEVRWGPHPYDDYGLYCAEHVSDPMDSVLPDPGTPPREYAVTIFHDRDGRAAA